MATLNDTRGRLAQVNPDTAKRFEQLSAALERRFSEDELATYCDHCLVIADSGWRSYEALDQYLALAMRLNDSELLDAGAVGRRLSGYSYEPSLNYFQTIDRVLTLERSDLLPAIDRLALSVQSQYPHASALVTGCLKSAAAVLAATGQLESWLTVTTGLLARSREDLTQFVRLSGEQPEQPWSRVRRFGEKGSPITYMESWRLLSGCFGDDDWRLVDELLYQNAHRDPTGLVDGLRMLSQQDAATRRWLLQLVTEIAVPAVSELFLLNADRLPLQRPAVVRQWADAGMQLTAGGEAAVLAWFGLASRRSVDLLEQLEGQVRLEDHKRLFELLIEAVAGRQVPIRVDDDDDFRAGSTGLEHLPGSDGSQIVLPPWVNLFDRYQDNFGFYKVSIFHQLGYREFGCFAEIHTIIDQLRQMEDVPLAEQIFLIVEDARIDWQLARRFAGLKPQLALQKSAAAQRRVLRSGTPRAQLLEAMVRCSLDDRFESVVDESHWPEAALIWQQMETLRFSDSVGDSVAVTRFCYGLIRQLLAENLESAALTLALTVEELPEPVSYRGEMEVAAVEATMKIEALVEQIEEALASQPEQALPAMSAMPDPDQLELGELKPGDISQGVAILLEELDRQVNPDQADLQPGDGERLSELLGSISSRTRERSLHRYDEWDHEINDYRARWCTLHEFRDMPLDEDYFRATLMTHEALSRHIRTELNRVKPEMLRKVKGVIEGEELDLERTIAYLVDRRAGLTPDDSIYVQRQRRERDVSTLFLLDMSASTDDIVPDPDAEPMVPPDVDDDQYLADFFEQKRAFDADARRIIDLEKESVILMAEALETLGDAYSVCGFSGYGREQVDYYLCKDFDEPLNADSMARIGGIRACRSTRMGAPIRHATRRLLETGSRIKALIIISDGYPQDHDYGADRNSRQYGLMDTMKALTEAKQQGVLTYCLTVDPSGHDYLRAMCPDSQYMVIQDIAQLPEELSRVYRSLTG